MSATNGTDRPAGESPISQIAEAITVLSAAVDDGTAGGAEVWPDGVRGTYAEAPTPSPDCPDADICVHEGKVYIHVKE